VKHTTLASAAVPALAEAQASGPVQTKETLNRLPVRVGMTDWNLGQRGDITKIALAREIGLDGIQVSVQYPTDGKTPTLRDTKTQADFRRAALDNGIQICSLACRENRGCRCTRTRPPPSTPSRPKWLHNLGTNILLPILATATMTNQCRRPSSP
jgi:hypothetical protein